MNILKSKKGIGLPAMLGIVTFLMATIGGLLTFSVHQSRLIEHTVRVTESEIEANNALRAALHIIMTKQSLDGELLDQIKSQLNVNFISISDSLVQLSHPLYNGNVLTSYVSGSATLEPLEDILFNTNGTNPLFPLNALITPLTLFQSYLVEYYQTFFPSQNLQTDFYDFDDVFDYFYELSSSTSLFNLKTPNQLSSHTILPNEHWFINNDYTLGNGKTLVIPDGYMLFINGDLTLNRGTTLVGNVIVNGDVKVKSHGNNVQTVRATIYINGSFSSERNLTLGTISRPTFIFAVDDIEIRNQTSGVGYFIADEFDSTSGSGSISITGGVYTIEDTDLGSATLIHNNDLNTDAFNQQAIPTYIYVDPEDSSGEGQTTFKFTSPRVG